MKNPVLSSFRNTYIYFMIWGAMTILHTFILFKYYGLDLLPAFADGVAFVLTFSALALTFWYTVRYLNIDARNPTAIILNHLFVAVVFIMVWLFMGYILISLLVEKNPVYFEFFSRSFPWRIISGLLYYLLMIFFYYLCIYYSSFREKLIKEASLRTLIKETELSLLKSQINPHFIFNSLNSINSLTYTNPELASEMIVKLSSFLRYALEQTSKQLVLFSQELDNCMLYLDIEKTRFGERLIVETKIDPDCMDMKIPNLILQPLLENAIKYGVYESTEPVTIRLTGQMEDHFLHLSLLNDYDKEALPKKGKGIGLRNVMERLFLIYNNRELIHIADTGSSFRVDLFIPQNIES